MKSMTCALYLLWIFSITPLYSLIREVSTFEEISPLLKKEALIILDIDDTLLIPTQMLGCDMWFQHRMQEHQKSGLKEPAALEKTLAEWEAIRHLSIMEMVEPKTDALVALWQAQTFPIMGLTTQGLALATRTSQQLSANHFDLQATAPSKEDHYFPIDGHGVLYRNGILFTSGMSKGKSLFALFDKISYFPKCIIFVNDKATHLQDIEQVALERGVEFIGLRYAYSDTKKASFSSAIANYQFNHSTFTHLLSDEEARVAIELSH